MILLLPLVWTAVMWTMVLAIEIETRLRRRRERKHG